MLWPMWVGSMNLKLMIATIYRTSLNSTTKSPHLRTGIQVFGESVKKALKQWLRGRQQGKWIEPWFSLKWSCGSVHKGWQLTGATRKLQIQAHEKLTEHARGFAVRSATSTEGGVGRFSVNNRWAGGVSTSTEEGSTWNMIFIWGKQPGFSCLRESQLKADLKTSDWMFAKYDFWLYFLHYCIIALFMLRWNFNVYWTKCKKLPIWFFSSS